MGTSRNTWKARERHAAAAIGARRQPCSGSSGRSDQTRSDSTSKYIYLEGKLREKHAVVTLWDDAAAKAAKEGKVPLLALTTKFRPGVWWVLHHKHVAAMIAVWLAQQDSETVASVLAMAEELRHE
jgi:hypothetical protein